MEAVTTYLETLVRETQKSETELIAQAIPLGLRQMQREYTLAAYLKGELDREAAIEAVGIDWVELAEQQHTAMLEDLTWATQE
jgi:hypothetical protein